MPTVLDKSGNNPIRDKSYMTYNRTVANTPVATETPEYAGEIVLDLTNDQLWKAEGTTDDTWVQIMPSVGGT